MTRICLVFASLVIVRSPAHASSHASSHGESAEDKLADAAVLAADQALQWEGSTAFEIGTFHTASIYNLAYGVDLQGGARLNRIAVYGDYSLLGLSTGDPSYSSAAYYTNDGSSPLSEKPSGLVQRFGLNAHYSIGRFITAFGGAGLVGDFWIEAGLGEQLVRWNEGGRLHRADVSFGIGAQLGGRGTEHHGGYFLGLRVTASQTPAGYVRTEPTCAGPCDTATPPLGLDKSVLLTTGIVFGS
jgi:hypothetical protein